jgi:hypothetical protein
MQLTPLARPQSWCIFHARLVLPVVPFIEAASGAIEA